MGAFNFYRRFVKNYAAIAQPINQLLKDDEPFIWTSERQIAFDRIKAELFNNAIIYSPDPNKPYVICLDASDRAVGAVTSQVGDDGKERAVAFMSKTLDKAQVRYHSNEKECLALILCLRQIEEMIGPSATISIYSDNLTNVYIKSLQDRTGKLFRYKMFLSQFKLDVKHKKGSLNVIADLMSRIFFEGQDTVPEEEEGDDHCLITSAQATGDARIQGTEQQSSTNETVQAIHNTGGFPGNPHWKQASHQGSKPASERFDALKHIFGPANYPTDKRTQTRQKPNPNIGHHKHTYVNKTHVEMMQEGLDEQDSADQSVIESDDDEFWKPPAPAYAADVGTTASQQSRMPWNPGSHSPQRPVPAAAATANAAQHTHIHRNNHTNAQQLPPHNYDKQAQDRTNDDIFSEGEAPLYQELEQINEKQVQDIYTEVLGNLRKLAADQATDKQSADLYHYKLTNQLPEPLDRARRVSAEKDKFYLNDHQILYRMFHAHPGTRMCHQLVLPAQYRYQITTLFHHGLHGAHRGFQSLMYLIRQRFYWRNMYDDLLNYTRSCQACGAAKRDYANVKAPLLLRPRGRPFETVHLDVLKIGPTNGGPTNGGELKVMTMVCRCTGHFEVEPIASEQSKVLAATFLRSWIQRFGPPRLVVLDNAAAHLASTFRALADEFNVSLRHIVAYRAQSNSAIERIHSKILVSLRACMMEHKNTPWTHFLSHIRFAHDMSIQPNGYSPYELMYGLEPSLSGDLDLDPPILLRDPPKPFLESVWPDLVAMRSSAAKNAREAAQLMQNRYQKRYNARVKGYLPGSLVWVSIIATNQPAQRKLIPKFRGPYTVMSSPLPGYYVLRFQNEIVDRMYPQDRLKTYYPVGHSPLRPRIVTGDPNATGRANEEHQTINQAPQIQRQGQHREFDTPRNARQEASDQAPRHAPQRAPNHAVNARLKARREANRAAWVRTTNPKSTNQPAKANQGGNTNPRRNKKSVNEQTDGRTSKHTHAHAHTRAPTNTQAAGQIHTRTHKQTDYKPEKQPSRNLNKQARGGHSNQQITDKRNRKDRVTSQVQTHRPLVDPGPVPMRHGQNRYNLRARLDPTRLPTPELVSRSRLSATATPFRSRLNHEVSSAATGSSGTRNHGGMLKPPKTIKSEVNDSLRESSDADSESSVQHSSSGVHTLRKYTRLKNEIRKKKNESITHSDDDGSGAPTGDPQNGSHGQYNQYREKSSLYRHDGDSQSMNVNEGSHSGGLPTINTPRIRSKDIRENHIMTRNVMPHLESCDEKHPTISTQDPLRPTMQIKHSHGDAEVIQPTAHVGGKVRAGQNDLRSLRRIITSKQQKNSVSYLCAWVGKRPTWVQSHLIPRSYIEEYEQRIRQREIKRQLAAHKTLVGIISGVIERSAPTEGRWRVDSLGPRH